jgi:hypothetical protein
MNALISIEVVESPGFVYENPSISWVKKEYPKVITFDLDNHSDSTLFSYASKLIENEDKIIIYIDVKNEAGAGKLLGLVENIIKNKDKCLVIMKGNSRLLQKMFSLLKESFRLNPDEPQIKNLINDLLR